MHILMLLILGYLLYSLFSWTTVAVVVLVGGLVFSPQFRFVLIVGAVLVVALFLRANSGLY